MAYLLHDICFDYEPVQMPGDVEIQKRLLELRDVDEAEDSYLQNYGEQN